MGPQSSTWQFCDPALFGMVKWPKLRFSDLMEIIPLLGGHHHFHWFSGHVNLGPPHDAPPQNLRKSARTCWWNWRKSSKTIRIFYQKIGKKNSPTPRGTLAVMIPRNEGPGFFGWEVPLCSSVSSFDISASGKLDRNDLDQGSKHERKSPQKCTWHGWDV